MDPKQTDDMNIPAEDLAAVDSYWHGKLKSIDGGGSEITLYTGSKEHSLRERTKFLSTETGNPVLDYPNIKIDDLNESEVRLTALKEELLAQEKNEAIQKAYLWKLNERIASLRMTRTTKEIEELASSGSDNPNPLLKNKLKRFQKYTEYLHGKPSKDIFAYSVNLLRNQVTESLEAGDVDYRNVAREFLTMIPEWKGSYEKPHPITQDTIDHVREETSEELGHLLHFDNPKDSYAPEDVQLIFENILQRMEAAGWTVVLHPVQRFMSINQKKKVVSIPAVTSQDYTHKRLQALIAHELGTHVQRRLNGERSKFLLLSTGFDRYLAGEEGVATVREQAISGDFSTERWLERHVAIGMTLGLDGTKRDFREIFEVMWRYYYLDLRRGGESHDNALIISRNKSYDRCVRTFRGTDGNSRGYCYTKDIDYAEGNIGVWDLVGKKPDELLRFSMGKYDPMNERHVWILSQLGITDLDLRVLELDDDSQEKTGIN